MRPNTTRAGEGVTTGNVAELVIVKVTEPAAYQPLPSHPGFGTVVAVVH